VHDSVQLRGGQAIEDHHPSTAVPEPILQRILAEQCGQRYCYRAQLVGGNVSQCGLGPLGEDDGHPVSAPDTQPGERVRPSIRPPRQVRECIAVRLGPGGIDQSHAVWVLRPLVANVNTYVVDLGNPPLKSVVELLKRAAVKADKPHPAPRVGTRYQGAGAISPAPFSLQVAGLSGPISRAARSQDHGQTGRLSDCRIPS